MPTKRSILEHLKRADLIYLLEHYELEVEDKRVRDQLLDVLGNSRKAPLTEMLEWLGKDSLQALCKKFGENTSGNKEELAERIVNSKGQPQPARRGRPKGSTIKASGAKPKGRPRKTAAKKGNGTPPKKKSRPDDLISSTATTAPSVAHGFFSQPATAWAQKYAETQREQRKASGRYPIAPGARILVRDAEWLVRRVDRTSTGSRAITCVGISELVRDREAIFLDDIDHPVVLDPASTKIVVDGSSSYQASLLYMESLLRQTPPTDENLYIGHRAAMDLVPFQLDPTIQALEQPRQRILVADAVGLGKTLECGILLSELIRRGKGKRILVLAIKSMLTQFQKELWARFAIPLTRLDSVGIQRIRHRIPTNHNPFYYFDKAIISIDTLKQDAEYRSYLENAYWDIIVVDEAHNVAERGTRQSMRARLAKLLSSRSDTLIMLSATPHDGKARSFASLMNMLDPTAIANPEDYGPEDIKGLFIRRFKKDIKDQVERSFKERKISVAHCRATPVEEQAFDRLTSLDFVRIDRRKSAGHLFKTVLEKSMFSSPAACLETVAHRMDRLGEEQDEAAALDIEQLGRLREALAEVDERGFAKYQKLLEVIRDPRGLNWDGKDPSDRLVIFTERIATMHFLREHLQRDLGLPDEAIVSLDGGMSDVDQQAVVEAFGKDQAPVRLLVASDVASEGINLHYLSHKMVHFDIPWSLMVFQQRNGRIDRYGQEREPRIVYLVTDSDNPKIRGDSRILEVLINKDDEAVRNIGDPSVWMGVYDIDSEELITGQAMEEGESAEGFDEKLQTTQFDPLAVLLQGMATPVGEQAQDRTRPVHSLFADDFAYVEAAIKQMQQDQWLQVELDSEARRVELTATEDLAQRFKFLPPEAWPDQGGFVLSASKDEIQDEIRRCRKDEHAWPTVQYLWPLHPVMEWVNDKVLAAFGRHEAPLITLPAGALANDETVFVLSGLIPNRKGHPLVHEWFAVRFKGGKVERVEPFAELQRELGLGSEKIPNRGDRPEDAAALQRLLPRAVERAREHMREEREVFEGKINAKLNEQLKDLERLRGKQYSELDRQFADSRQAAAVVQDRKQGERRRIDKIFDEFIDWVEDTMTTEDNPFIQLVAVLR